MYLNQASKQTTPTLGMENIQPPKIKQGRVCIFFGNDSEQDQNSRKGTDTCISFKNTNF